MEGGGGHTKAFNWDPTHATLDTRTLVTKTESIIHGVFFVWAETQCWRHLVCTGEGTQKNPATPHNLIAGNKKLLRQKEVLDTQKYQRARLQEDELKAGEGQIRNTMSKESGLI